MRLWGETAVFSFMATLLAFVLIDPPTQRSMPATIRPQVPITRS